MKKENSIEINNVSKEYRLGVVNTGTLSHDINRWWHRFRGKDDPYLKIGEENIQNKKTKSEYIMALNDVNLSVKQGEVLGIIGKNGAGKSTLLKILSKVTGPSTGEIKYRGRIASLLEVGTGFHLELTGKENIFLNGAILGMSKSEIKRKFDEIVEFSGCLKYVDTPVKRYSSGMLVRLGFAVAAFLEPEILVVDEVLAVGDAEFQKKAIGKMQDVSQNEGRTVLFVSHNMAAIKTLCTSAVLLHNGQVKTQGSPNKVISEYLKGNSNIITKPLPDRKDRRGSGKVIFDKVLILDNRNKIKSTIATGDDIVIKIKFQVNDPNLFTNTPLEIGLILRDQYDSVVTTFSSFFTDESPIGLTDNSEILCIIDKLPLISGQYYLDLWCATSAEDHDFISKALQFNVVEGNYFNSKHTWRPRADRHGYMVTPQSWKHIINVD